MEYTRSEYAGDYNIDETFIGEPKEILELIDGIEGKKDDFTYNQEEAIDFIFQNTIRQETSENKFKQEVLTGINRSTIRAILDLEENYMRSVGIIED